jgi:hypothetical protein
MSTSNQSLLFDIDVSELELASQIIGAMPREVEAAFNRATKRTEVTMRKRSVQALRDGIVAKSGKVIQRRMQAYRYAFRLGQTTGNFDALKLWYGLSDISIGKLKGRSSRIGSKRSPQGASFSSPALGKHDFDTGFVAKLNSRRSIFSRKGLSRFPVREAQIPIYNRLHEYLEDEVLSELPDVFMSHYVTDLTGRVAARDQIAQRQKKWK